MSYFWKKDSVKKFSILFSVLAMAVLFSYCEKDDICDQPTTPRLIMEFYDIANPTVPKNVSQLEVTGVGLEDSLAVFNGENRVELPLDVSLDTAAYSFVINSTNTAADNEDVVTFNYTRNSIFVSRGCGYKTQFTLGPAPFSQVDGAAADGLWMQNITVTQPNIFNENEVHVKVYF
jgi:hypothetical protein